MYVGVNVSVLSVDISSPSRVVSFSLSRCSFSLSLSLFPSARSLSLSRALCLSHFSLSLSVVCLLVFLLLRLLIILSHLLLLLAILPSCLVVVHTCWFIHFCVVCVMSLLGIPSRWLTGLALWYCRLGAAMSAAQTACRLPPQRLDVISRDADEWLISTPPCPSDVQWADFTQDPQAEFSRTMAGARVSLEQVQRKGSRPRLGLFRYQAWLDRGRAYLKLVRLGGAGCPRPDSGWVRPDSLFRSATRFGRCRQKMARC